MSMFGTLAKVAAGALVARGVGKMMANRGGGAQQGGQMGGLGGLLGGLAGGGQQGGAQGGQMGGLGGILGQLTGGAQGGASGGMGGLGGLLGGLAGGGAAAGGAGGLGGLLESLGAPAGGAGTAGAAAQGGGLGGMLNSAFGNGGEPEQSPTPDQESVAALMIRAMLQAAKSDGQIDDSERAKLLEHLGDATQQEMAFVQEQLSAPVDVQGLAADVPSGMEQQVYLMSVMAIDLDSMAEAQYLDQLAKAMNLAPEAVNGIHAQLGVPALYS